MSRTIIFGQNIHRIIIKYETYWAATIIIIHVVICKNNEQRQPTANSSANENIYINWALKKSNNNVRKTD